MIKPGFELVVIDSRAQGDNYKLLYLYRTGVFVRKNQSLAVCS